MRRAWADGIPPGYTYHRSLEEREREIRMTKVVYVMFKKEGMSREEFRRYWKDAHAPVAKQMPGLREYVQNHALADPEANEPPYDGFEELYFESQEAMEEAIASSEGQATINDLPNFCDTAKTLGIAVEEVE
jgi:uncharacterized protein (TIGR02118 family)